MPHINEEADDTGAGELILYIDNDEPLYRQHQSIRKNLATKMAKGSFDPELAAKLYMYLVDAGAKKYTKEFGTPGSQRKPLELLLT